MPKKVPLNELAVAVQSAVEQVLAKHGAVTIDKLWVGFVAPDTLQVSQAEAAKIASHIATGPAAHASVVALPAGTTTGVHTEALQKPGHIIGLIFQPKLDK